MRQGMRVLRGAVYARSGAQPRERFRVEGSARACGAWLFGSAASRTDCKLVRRSFFAQDAVFGVAAGCGGATWNTARALYNFASTGFYSRHCAGDRVAAKGLQSRAPTGAVRLHEGAACHAAD